MLISVIDKPYYQVYSIVVELLAAIIMVIMLVTLYGLPKYGNQKLRRTFIICLLVGILVCLVDSSAYYLYKNESLNKLFEVICEISAVLCSTFLLYTGAVIIRYLGIKDKIDRFLAITSHSIYLFGILCNAIPPIYKKIILANGNSEISYSKFYFAYGLILSLANLFVIFFVLKNRKQIKPKYTILVLLLKIMPFVCFIVFDDTQPEIFILSTLCLLVSYILVLQDRFNMLLQKEKEVAKQNIELANVKTKMLLSNVKPHFIYNALESIAQLCTENPKKAKALTVDFACYLRNSIDSVNDDVICCEFETELEHIKSYLNIELVRFEDTLSVEYDIKAVDFTVPSLSVQPLVENAVKHGVRKKEEGGTVKIATAETEEGWLVTVSDDGAGFDKENYLNDGKNHFGIANIEKRISMYGGKLNIESEKGVGTVATIFIPKRRAVK